MLRILYALTDEVAQHAELLRSNQQIMEDLDFIFAKGKLSQVMKATCPEVGLAPASELYPADYDFSIVFDSVATRKARHQMSKHHVEGLVVKEESVKE